MGFFDKVAEGWRWATGADDDHDEEEVEYQQQQFGINYRPSKRVDEEDDDEPEYSDNIQGEFHGPYLKYMGMDVNRRIWKASVMVVCGSDQGMPGLFLETPHGRRCMRGFVLERFERFTFWRYDLKLPVTDDEYKFTYYFAHVPDRRHEVCIPAFHDRWRMLFYSCNGFSSDVDETRQQQENGIQPLWEDVFRFHRQAPYHVQIGGGDQIYMDLVWHQVPLLKEWTEFTKEAKCEEPFSRDMKETTEEWYFREYIRHFGDERFREALACIPYIFILDDHDIWDGYGSYPESLQLSPVFQGAARVAFTFYLLFQQHTTRRRARKDGYIGVDGWSYVRMCGPDTAVLCPDTRAERSLQQVIHPESWREIESELSHIPRSVKHLIVVAAIPIAYPRLEAQCLLQISKMAMWNTLEFFDNVSKVFPWHREDEDDRKEDTSAISDFVRKTGAYKNLINNFGESELMDDLNDHWTAECHVEERRNFIEMLQRFAESRGVRVSIVSGDVHCAGIGKFHGKGMEDSPHGDAHTMYNVISSAIGNIPPPNIVIKTLHHNAEIHELNDHSEERMVTTFHEDPTGEEREEKLLINRRNWCDILPDNYGGLNFRLHVEQDDKWAPAKIYDCNVPAVQA